MNIDLYIDFLKGHCTNLDHEEMDGIAEWLEELKHYKEIENSDGRSFLTTDQVHDLCTEAQIKGRTDAIDEILTIIRDIYNMDLHCKEDLCERNKYEYDCEDCLYASIRNRIEQLKEQNNVYMWYRIMWLLWIIQFRKMVFMEGVESMTDIILVLILIGVWGVDIKLKHIEEFLKEKR